MVGTGQTAALQLLHPSPILIALDPRGHTTLHDHEGRSLIPCRICMNPLLGGLCRLPPFGLSFHVDVPAASESFSFAMAQHEGVCFCPRAMAARAIPLWSELSCFSRRPPDIQGAWQALPVLYLGAVPALPLHVE